MYCTCIFYMRAGNKTLWVWNELPEETGLTQRRTTARDAWWHLSCKRVSSKDPEWERMRPRVGGCPDRRGCSREERKAESSLGCCRDLAVCITLPGAVAVGCRPWGEPPHPPVADRLLYINQPCLDLLENVSEHCEHSSSCWFKYKRVCGVAELRRGNHMLVSVCIRTSRSPWICQWKCQIWCWLAFGQIPNGGWKGLCGRWGLGGFVLGVILLPSNRWES